MAFLKLTCEVQLRMSAGVPIKVVLDKPVFPWMEFPSQRTNSNRKGRHQIRVPTLNRHQIGSWDHRLEFLIGFPLHWRASAHSWTSGFTTCVFISWVTSKTSAGNGLELFSGTLWLFQCPNLLAVFHSTEPEKKVRQNKGFQEDTWHKLGNIM